MIELLIAIAILGFFSTLTLLEMGFINNSENEFDQFLSFARTQHGKSLRTADARELVFHPNRDEITVRESGKDKGDQFELEGWSIVGTTARFSVVMTPVGVKGPRSIKLSSNTGQEVELTPHYTLGLKVISRE